MYTHTRTHVYTHVYGEISGRKYLRSDTIMIAHAYANATAAFLCRHIAPCAKGASSFSSSSSSSSSFFRRRHAAVRIYSRVAPAPADRIVCLTDGMLDAVNSTLVVINRLSRYRDARSSVANVVSTFATCHFAGVLFTLYYRADQPVAVKCDIIQYL